MTEERSEPATPTSERRTYLTSLLGCLFLFEEIIINNTDAAKRVFSRTLTNLHRCDTILKSMQNIAIIGCGRVANHIAHFFENGLNGASVLYTCDTVKERADALSKRLGATAVYEINDVLLDPQVDVVLILTESGKHTLHARMALLAGKHVIVEKPVGLIPKEVIENDRIAKEKGLMYAAIKQNRLNPAITHLKQTVESGRFGKLILGSIRRLLLASLNVLFSRKGVSGS